MVRLAVETGSERSCADERDRTRLLSTPGEFVKSTMFTFHTKQCVDEVYQLGFPFDHIDLPDYTFEFAQVRLGLKP